MKNNSSSVLFSLCFLLFVVLGCGDLDKNSNNNSTVTTPTATPQPIPTESQYDSGGLGLDLSAWAKLHGVGKPDSPSSPMFFSYENGKFIVQYSKVSTGNVKYIERSYGDQNAVSIEQARKESKSFIPKDAKFVKTYKSQSGSTVDLYQSESLKSRFSEESYIGGKPGDFIILYRNQTGKTTTFIISVGNNP